MKAIFFILLIIQSSIALSQQVKLVPFRKDRRYGYCTLDGEIAIKPAYLYANLFSNKIAAVRIQVTDGNSGKKNDRTIYIDESGTIAVNDTFYFGGNYYLANIKDSSGQISQSYIAEVTKQGNTFHIFEDGKVVTSHILSPSELRTQIDLPPDPIVLLGQEKKSRKSGKKQSGAYVKDSLWGVQRNGKSIIPPQYNFIYDVDLKRKIFIVHEDNSKALLKIKRKATLKWYIDINEISSSSSGTHRRKYFFSAKDSTGLYGIIDDEYNIMLNHSYQSIGGRADKNGAVLISQQSSRTTKGKVFGLFSLRDQALINPKYEKIISTVLPGVYQVEYLGQKNRIVTYYININGREYLFE